MPLKEVDATSIKKLETHLRGIWNDAHAIRQDVDQYVHRTYSLGDAD